MFAVILEDFEDELDAVKAIITTFSAPGAGGPKTRVAAANSATLLLAATFEEFVREMARAYARAVVAKRGSISKIPSRIASTAWRRSMESLAKLRVAGETIGGFHEATLSEALSKFNSIHAFYQGDITQDIYQDLIHNENNMRPNEINSLFRVSDLSDVCRAMCNTQSILTAFDETDSGKAHGHLLRYIEAFIERRNKIAHSIAIMRSSGPNVILNDIEILRGFGKALHETIEAHSHDSI